MTKFCPACGEALIDDAKFCKSCGASLSGAVNRQSVPERPLVEKSYTAITVIGYILAFLLPLLGVICAIYLLTRKDSEDANKHGKYMIIVAVVIWAISFLMVMG
ncbi:zinc-ribbon domain-containing protein [Methanobrevibacter sp.]|uniref:zinc-ribbon domain-containing protein n=1 Tax=Methanobrevibacter sp. TaxID=66852 RepID=UPI0025E0BD90|nr:zinc-ribbon domain-containing protein [Methanobrevibacter sp.]MBQ6512544.1 zinc-ribbon domain-containing protein [Methanobrevibacter sp.]